MRAYTVRLGDWTRDLDALRRIRTQVFIEEQKVPVELEWDEIDSHCVHVLALAGAQPIATGRLTPDGYIGRMAVLAPWRGRGVGAEILQKLLQIARDRGDRECRLNAQTHARGFYARFGFEAEGTEFLEAGIPHQAMRLRLGPKENIVAGPVALADALESLAQSARHRFNLYSDDLAPLLCDRLPFAAALRKCALSGPRASIRILCRDAQAAAGTGHALLRLAAAIPSHVELRRLAATDEPPTSLYAWTDTGNAFHQPDAGQYSAVILHQAPIRVRELAREFQALWERAEPDPEIRQFRL